MVELRKRKAPTEAAPPPPAKKSSNPIKKAIDAAKEAVTGNSESSEGATNGSAKIAVGQTIALEGFGGELETHTGDKVTLHKLLEQSQAGVVLFTYPKANTPGYLGGGLRLPAPVFPPTDHFKGTTQACLFRDNYSSITAAGLSVYGLSTDSSRSNTTFATKNNLPFPLLCDPSATLTGAIGMKKAAKSTSRGVVVIDKAGKVQVWEQAGPQKTVDAVMGYLQTSGSGTTSAPPAPASDTTMADAPPAVASTEMAPTTATETAPATATEMAPPTTTEAQPPTETGSTSTAFANSTAESAPAQVKDDPPKMDEVPLAEAPSAEEKQAADTAAEVGETAAKIDSAEAAKA